MSFRELSQAESLKLSHLFTYHRPSESQVERLALIRQAAFQFARVIAENTCNSADQTVAIRKVREAVMVANAAIVLEPPQSEGKGND